MWNVNDMTEQIVNKEQKMYFLLKFGQQDWTKFLFNFGKNLKIRKNIFYVCYCCEYRCNMSQSWQWHVTDYLLKKSYNGAHFIGKQKNIFANNVMAVML